MSFFFDVPEKHILVSDGRYWLYCVNRVAPGVHKKKDQQSSRNTKWNAR